MPYPKRGTHSNAGAETFEYHRIHTFCLPVTKFAELLGTNRKWYDNFVTGRRKTRDYMVGQLLKKLDKLILKRKEVKK